MKHLKGKSARVIFEWHGNLKCKLETAILGQ